MKVLRSTLVIGLAAFAAACGDKVTVAGPTTPPTPVPTVNSVTVTPGTATLSVGQTVNFTAAVDASNGAATTVTWSSSDASKVSVSATGTATAVAATPGVAICATSTANTGKVGCASVVVQVAANFPATVSIQSITATGTNNVTVNPLAVAGGIDVRLNINPGSQTVTKVVLLVGSVRADSQTFTAAASAALRYAADKAIEAQTTFPQILFSVNTAAYAATTGTPKWLNGAQGVSAQLYTAAGGSSSAATATAQTNLTFANVDGFAITTSGGNTAVDGAGFRWTGNGSLTVNALPVMYSGSSIGTVNAALSANPATGSTCVAGVGALGSATTKTGNVYVITSTLAGLASPTPTCTTTFPNVVTITATNAAGDNLALAATAGAPAGVLGTQTGLRWDNIAPPTAGLLANPNGRANAWINDAVGFSTVNTGTTLDGWIAAAVVDANIGGTITYTVRVATTYASAKTAAGLTNATSLAPSATNATYCAIAYAADALGNTTGNPGGTCGASAAVAGVWALPAAGAGSLTFGLDRAAPTINYDVTSLAANARQSGASIGGEFVVTVSDTGLVGNSGMLPTSPVLMQLSRRVATANGAGTVSARNADGSAATTAGVLAATGVAAAAPLYSTTITAVTQTGYYSHVATAYDAAGNSASITSATGRIIVYDAPLPTVSATATPISITGLGWTANAFINDVLDIQTQWFSGDYSTATIAPKRLAQAPTAVNGFNAATFANTNYAISQAINVPLELQATAAATLYPLDGVEANAINQGNLLKTGATAVAPTFTAPAAIPTGAPNMTAYATPTFSVASNTISSGVTTAPTTANPASGTITTTTTGPTAVFNNPFSRVDFYMVSPVSAEYRLVGSTTASTLVDNGVTRVFTYSTTLNGAAVYAAIGATATTTQNVIAIGYNAAGTVGMFTGTYALTVVK